MKQSFLYAVPIIIALCCAPQRLHAQNSLDNSNPILTSCGLTYQNFIDSLSCKNRSFEDNYVLLKKIETVDPIDKVLDIHNKFLSQAKSKKDKKYSLSIYSANANLYLLMDKPEIARLYLDSAYQYLNKVDDSGILGVYYLVEGIYYSYIGNELDMVNSYYKSVAYYNEREHKSLAVIRLLYAIASYHMQYNDTQSLGKIMNQMLDVSKGINTPSAYISSYAVASAYYSLCWDNDSILSHRDSTMYYQEVIIDEYNRADDIEKEINRDLIPLTYQNMAGFVMGNINTKDCTYTWEDIAYYVKKSKEFRIEDDIELFSRYYCLQARIHDHYGRYKESLQCAEESLKIIERDHYVVKDISNLIDIYEILAKLEGEYKKDYKAALNYTNLLIKAQEKKRNDKQYKVGKELEVKYETTKKDLEIATLQIEKEREKRITAFLLVVGVLVIILLMIFLLYSRMRRLKKEKETTDLLHRIKEKELEFQSAITRSELNGMQSYLKGLETERERLAKELHDNVANELLSIDYQLKSISQIPEATSAQIENLHNEIRNISHELMPPLFKYANLPEIISDYLLKANKNTIAIDFQMDNEGLESILYHISEKPALEIYRIIQEAISNINKHSEATAAKITFVYFEGVLKLTIEDNGKGFDMNRKQTGIGIKIIKDRIAGLNGEVDIHSKPGGGCIINIKFPIAQLVGDKLQP